MLMIKKYGIYTLLVGAIIFFVYKKFIPNTHTTIVKTFKIQNGWGYNVLVNNKVYIHQEIIPAIEGRKNFVSEEDAEKTGALVANKLKKKQGGGLPQITVEEIDSLKITR